jgi:hypothetical protein
MQTPTVRVGNIFACQDVAPTLLQSRRLFSTRSSHTKIRQSSLRTTRPAPAISDCQPCGGCPFLSRTMKQAPFISSIVQGGGKRRLVIRATARIKTMSLDNSVCLQPSTRTLRIVGTMMRSPGGALLLIFITGDEAWRLAVNFARDAG